MAKIDRRLITATALAIVDSPDGNELTLSAIARQLEVTQPALYYHVDGLDDILRWIGLEVRVELVEVLSSASVGVSGADAVRAVANAWRGYSQEHPARYKSTDWHPVEGDAELEQAVGRVLTVLANSLRGYGLDEAQRATAALALRSALHGFASFELGAGNPAPQSADASFADVIDLLITGVESLGSGQRSIQQR